MRRMCSVEYGGSMAYKICIADSFEHDLDLVTAYISQVLQNPAAADNLLAKAEEIIDKIADFPFMFSFCPDKELAQKGYRNTPVGNYQLFYRVDERTETVYILRFQYAGREISSLLK